MCSKMRHVRCMAQLAGKKKPALGGRGVARKKLWLARLIKKISELLQPFKPATTVIVYIREQH